MAAIIEFGFDSSDVFKGVDQLDRKLQKMDASVMAAQAKLATALRNPWVTAGVNVQKYGAELVRAEKQARLLAAQTAKMASMQVTGVNYKAATNLWGTAGASQYAAQQEAARKASEAAAMLQSQQRAAEAAAAAQQRVAAANAATQQKAMAAAAASAALAAAEQRKAALQTNNGRMNLALLEAQIAGDKKVTAGIEARIALLERMRTIQAQTNVAQREAYALAQRSTGREGFFSRSGLGGGGAKLGIGMAAMQAQDIAVQMQMGTKMSTIIAQQGSQLLSIFGPGGMILGGLVAVGGMLYSVREKGIEAMKALKEEASGFDGRLRELKTGGISDMLKGMDEMKKRADEMREAASTAPGALGRFFSSSRFDSKTGSWTNSADEKNQISQDIADKNDSGRLALEKQIVAEAEKQLELDRLRSAGMDEEVLKLEAQIRLAKAYQSINGHSWESSASKNAYEKATESKIFAEVEKAQRQAAKVKEEEMKRIADAQKQFDERKLQAALEEMDLAKRIATMNAEAQKALAEENRLKAAAKRDEQAIIDAASRTLEINRERNRLQRQYADDKAREAKEAERENKRKTEEAQQTAKEGNQRRSAVTDTALEYKMLEAKAAGRNREIEQIEYQQRVLERSRRLEEQNGLGKREALAMAIKMTDLEDRANGKRGRIRGVQAHDADPNNRLGLSGRTGPLSKNSGPLSKGGPLSKNGGLEGFWNMQLGKTGQLGPGPSDFMNKNAFSDSPSLQATHEANAAKETPTSSPLVDSFLEKLVNRLPKALAEAILADT